MFLTLATAYGLSVVLVPDNSNAIESAKLESCSELTQLFEMRGVSTNLKQKHLISVVAQVFDQQALFTYRCFGGKIAIHGLVARIPTQKQAIAFHTRLSQALESEFGPAEMIGQDPLEPSCLFEKSDLTTLEPYNAVWLINGTHIITAVFMPSESGEWPVGAMLRSRDAPECGIHFDDH